MIPLLSPDLDANQIVSNTNSPKQRKPKYEPDIRIDTCGMKHEMKRKLVETLVDMKKEYGFYIYSSVAFENEISQNMKEPTD